MGEVDTTTSRIDQQAAELIAVQRVLRVERAEAEEMAEDVSEVRDDFRWVEQLEAVLSEPARDYHLRVGRLMDDSRSISVIYPCEEYQGIGATYREALDDLLQKIHSLEWNRG